MEAMDRVFFVPGDLVTVKHDMANKPEMLVLGKETKTIRGAEGVHFKGIRCMWFTVNGDVQERVFNTKDLVHIKK